MKNLLKLSACLLCISLWFYTGCSSNDEPEPFDCSTSDISLIEVKSIGVTDCSAEDGEIEVEVSGGAGPYEYKLGANPFQVSPIFVNLISGTYTVTVRDNRHCEFELGNIIVENANTTLAGQIENGTEDTGCTTDNGSVSVSATGGVPPYEFTIGSSTLTDNPSVFLNLKSGDYNILIQDADGCKTTLVSTVENGTGIDYDNDILPIFQAKCQFSGCHPSNGDWFDYATAKNKAQTIKTKTGNGEMPRSPQPGGSLSQSQIDAIACWADNGAPKN